MNYTADVSPNFNVTSIITNSTDIFLGSPYYDLAWSGHQINANITGFSEGDNFTAHITDLGTTGVTMRILGQLQEVKLDGAEQTFGSTWNYGTCGSLICTTINVGSHLDMFLSWGGGTATTSNFNVTGYVLANNGIFNDPSIELATPATANVTALLLWNTNGNLVSYQDLSANPVQLTAGIQTSIPVSLQDNSNPTGLQTYYEQAILQTSAGVSLITTNHVTLDYGSFVTGNLNFNFTNNNVVPIYFIRDNLNSTDTRLSVIYPNIMSMECNMNYTFAMTNQTYGPPLSSIPFDVSNSNSSFKFHNLQNEIVNVLCTDSITGSNAKYVLTQTSFPFQQQVENLRNGTYGTHGQIGILDFVTIGIIIISMIGFNRVNETVGVIFSVAIIGACAFFGFIALPTFIAGAITISVLIAILSTRKSGGF
jgi:hypothetical protein